MRLYSTADPSEQVDFVDAVLKGSPRSGGLFHPVSIPRVADIDTWLSMDLVSRSVALAQLWIGDELAPQAIGDIVEGALTFDAPVRQLADGLHVLELFHGPTLAFKDFGARFMAQVMGHLVSVGRSRGQVTILTATSGDTGAAVAHAFYKVPGVQVVVLYPKGRISQLQEALFCALGHNVTTLRVDGAFDDCQALVKAAFQDRQLVSTLGLTSANSINFSRLLAQTFYFFEAVARVGGAPVIAVPSGNFGDLTAGLFAQQMGLPVTAFVAATNSNDIVPRYLAGEAYSPRPSVATLSNAMDVGAPSNWARIYELFGRDDGAVRAALRSGSCDDTQTRAAMRELRARFGYVACPHTAVAYDVSQRCLVPSEQAVFLSTAHPAKFQEVVEQTLGEPVALPPELSRLQGQRLLSIDLPADQAALKEQLLAI